MASISFSEDQGSRLGNLFEVPKDHISNYQSNSPSSSDVSSQEPRPASPSENNSELATQNLSKVDSKLGEKIGNFFSAIGNALLAVGIYLAKVVGITFGLSVVLALMPLVILWDLLKLDLREVVKDLLGIVGIALALATSPFWVPFVGGDTIQTAIKNKGF